jgi:hypothetical protein
MIPRRMRWSMRVASVGEVRIAYKILIGNFEEGSLLVHLGKMGE